MDGPYTVWVESPTTEKRIRVRAFESLKVATVRATRIFLVAEAEMAFGVGVHITDGRGETISSQVVQ